MVKFIYGDKKSTDAEEALNKINNYVMLRENGICPDCLTEDIHERLYESEELVANVNLTYDVNPALSLSASTKLKSLFRKIVCVFVQWAFKDVMSRQNEFNARVVQYINSDALLIKDLAEECNALKEENDKLRLQLLKHA